MSRNKGITLVALVITIIILLILAGITISQLTGNGLFENAKLSKEKSTRAEMAETLTLALQELQLEKKGKATISDITQEWVDSKLTEYKNTVTEDAENNSKTITMEKDGITVNYILNEKLGVSESTVPVAKFKIQVTDPIISTNTSAAVSDAAGGLSRGTASYISFTATLDVDEGECIISPELPYKVLGNGTYTFTVTGTHEGATVTKEVKVNVNQYKAPVNYVQYDAGDWTQEEIAKLQDKSLYNININKSKNKTFSLKDSTGLNFTFGGFTYLGDTTNTNAISTGTIATSRNQSISPESPYGTPTYDGWQILEKQTKTNDDGIERTYVTKLVHAGSPENFVYGYTTDNDAYRAEYLLTGKANYGDAYKTLSDGTTSINPRNWDIYRDKELNAKGYIKEVHAMTYNEANSAVINGLRNINACYYVSTPYNNNWLYDVTYRGDFGGQDYYCLGIRPVIEMNDGVYIASGNGTAASPYVLGKE